MIALAARGTSPAVFDGDLRGSNQVVQNIACAAVLRNPVDFLKLGITAYLDYLD